MKQQNEIQHFEFFKQFNKLKPYPIYVVYGAENYLKDKIKNKLLEEYLDEKNDFDFAIFYGDECENTEVIEQLETMPFLSNKKIVVLKNFDYLKPQIRGALADYSEKPLKTSLLILLADKFDKRLNDHKKIMKKALSIECKHPYNANQIAMWLKTELKNKNLEMDPDAIDLFANSIDTDYLIAATELEKLRILTKDADYITIDDVRTSVGQSRVHRIFDLQNHIGSKNLKAALRTLENMLNTDNSSIFIVTMLTRFFMILWKIEALREKNISDSEISNRHLQNIFYKYRKDYLEHAANYNMKAIRQNLSYLLDADSDLKSLNLKDNIIMEPLLVRLIGS